MVITRELDIVSLPCYYQSQCSDVERGIDMPAQSSIFSRLVTAVHETARDGTHIEQFRVALLKALLADGWEPRPRTWLDRFMRRRVFAKKGESIRVQIRRDDWDHVCASGNGIDFFSCLYRSPPIPIFLIGLLVRVEYVQLSGRFDSSRQVFDIWLESGESSGPLPLFVS